MRSDEDGFLWVVDRKKDMIISGGENIYCAEVEDALAAFPGIADVTILGVRTSGGARCRSRSSSPRDPESPPTLEELTAFCADRLAPYKRPRRIEVLAELPRNAGGKVLKRDLRDRFASPPPELSALPGVCTAEGGHSSAAVRADRLSFLKQPLAVVQAGRPYWVR